MANPQDSSASSNRDPQKTGLGDAVQIALHQQPEKGGTVRNGFVKFSQLIAGAMGTPWAFVVACLSIIIWAFTRKLFSTTDTWQLVINTGTTIVTFLMVFLIQNTQNRDSKAIHLKLDELIRSKKGARNTMVDLENCSEEELEQISEQFKRLRKRAGESSDVPLADDRNKNPGRE